MRRRDPLTYDTDPRTVRSRTSGLSRPMVVLLALVLALAVVLVLWTVQTPSRPSTMPATPGSSPSQAPTPSQPMSPASTPTPPGSDASTVTRAPDGSQTAAARFIAAWLNHDQKARKAALQATAAPGLAEQLMMTSADNIPTGRAAGSPTLEDASPYGAQFVQRLTSGVTVRVYLVSDPQAQYGWLATSVEKA